MRKQVDEDSRVRARLPAVLAQAVVVRTLVDDFDRTVPPDVKSGLGSQLAEELARLGCRAFEAAAALANAESLEIGNDDGVRMVVLIQT